MKKSIISISGIALLLISAITFNIVKYEQNKIKYCFIASHYWGLKVADFTTDGSNAIYACLQSNRYGPTIGNTESQFYTWHIEN